jgi:hypothetical protein
MIDESAFGHRFSAYDPWVDVLEVPHHARESQDSGGLAERRREKRTIPSAESYILRRGRATSIT